MLVRRRTGPPGLQPGVLSVAPHAAGDVVHKAKQPGGVRHLQRARRLAAAAVQQRGALGVAWGIGGASSGAAMEAVPR